MSAESAWWQYELRIGPYRRGFHLVTENVEQAARDLPHVEVGLLHLFLLHTSAALTINENADPTVPGDLEMSFHKIVPETWPYDHTTEGSDDMPAHVKCSILGCSLLLPVRKGRLVLGTWQGIYLCEHRDAATPRRIVLTLQGSASIG